MHKFVAIYSLDGLNKYMEFTTPINTFEDALNTWHQIKPTNSNLRLLSESKGFDWQIISGSDVDMYLSKP